MQSADGLQIKGRQMRRYYFDVRTGESLEFDQEGHELSSIEKAQEEASLSLAEMAKDAIRNDQSGANQAMSINVRDDGGPVLQVKCTFEIDRLAN